MFQRLQEERESEEKKLEASKTTLKEQQHKVEKELTDQKGNLERVLTELLVTEERIRALQKEERWGEALEKALSQTSMYSERHPRVGGGDLLVVLESVWRRPKAPAITHEEAGEAQQGARCPFDPPSPVRDEAVCPYGSGVWSWDC